MIFLTYGRTFNIPTYSELLSHTHKYDKETFESQLLIAMKDYYNKKKSRIASDRPFKKIVFENLIYRELQTEEMLRYLNGNISDFDIFYNNIYIDKNIVNKYIEMLETKKFKNINTENLMYFSSNTQNLYDNYAISYDDVLYQYLFDEFFHEYCSDILSYLGKTLVTPQLTREQKTGLLQNLLNIFNMEFCPLFDKFIVMEKIGKIPSL